MHRMYCQALKHPPGGVHGTDDLVPNQQGDQMEVSAVERIEGPQVPVMRAGRNVLPLARPPVLRTGRIVAVSCPWRRLQPET